MKKATSKRERKYSGKEKKDKEIRKVKVMVDYAVVREFKNKEEAEMYINKQHKEADKAQRPRTSFIYL